MTSPKRPRGRPRGSEKSDAPALVQVADHLVRDASLKPSTAMKRVMLSRKDWGATDATLLRRWQVKWKALGETLLAAARERAKRKPQPAPSYTGYHLSLAERLLRPSPIERLIEHDRRMEALFKPSPWEESVQRVMRREEDLQRAMKAQEDMRRALKWQEDLDRALGLTRGFDPFSLR